MRPGLRWKRAAVNTITPAKRDALRADLAGALSRAVRFLQPYESKAVFVPWQRYENQIALLVSSAFSERMRDILDNWPVFIGAFANGFVGEPEYWGAFQQHLQTVLTPVVQELALQGVAEAMRGEGGPTIVVDWNLANMQAREWASNHVAQLVKRVSDNTRQQIRDKVTAWIEQGGSIYDEGLAGQIMDIRDEGGNQPFGRYRARLIAQTESTNAYAAGNITAWSQRGYMPPAVTPSLHPGCRCYLRTTRLVDGSKVIVWHTVTDGRVCTRDVSTALGTVAGCAALDERIVSSGPYALMKPSDVGLYKPGAQQ